MSPGGARRASETPAGSGLPRYELHGWRDRFGIVAGVTGRETDFRLTTRPGEQSDDRAARLATLPGAVGGFQQVAASRQRHGTEIVIHPADRGPIWLGDGFDGHVTERPGQLVAVTVADCIPVYLAHPSSRTVALLHAGWRGTAAGILESGIRALCDAASGTPAEIVIHCGVGICGACYEVGHEVFRAVVGPPAGSNGRLDLRRALAERAGAAGVAEVTVSAWCTAHDHDRFHSHRRSGGCDGRMVAYLGRPAG